MNLLKFILKPYIKKSKNAYQIISLLLRNKTLSSGSNITISHHRNINLGNHVLLGDKVTLSCSKSGTIELKDLVKIGSGCSLNSSGNNKITVERGTSFHSNCVINGNVTIGKWCLFASNIFLSSHPHTFKTNPPMMIRDQDQQFFDINNPNNHIVIEDDCWLGWGVVVREGIRIGKGSVIGANSVVVKDVPPYSIVGGIPAKVIKSRLELKNLKEISASNEEERIYFWEGFRARKNELLSQGASIQLEKHGKVMISLGESSKGKIKLHSASEQNFKVSVAEFAFSQEFKLKKGENTLEVQFKSSTEIKNSQWLEIESEKAVTVALTSVAIL